MSGYFTSYVCQVCHGNFSFDLDPNPPKGPFLCERCAANAARLQERHGLKMVNEYTPTSWGHSHIQSMMSETVDLGGGHASARPTINAANPFADDRIGKGYTAEMQTEGREVRPTLYPWQQIRIDEMLEAIKEGKFVFKPARNEGKTRYMLEAFNMTDRSNSILHPWVTHLGLRHQGVLLTAIRGCDSAPKDDASKRLARCIRNAILRAHCGDARKSASFIEHCEGPELETRMDAFASNLDQYPWHYIAHIMHTAEILGYYHPTEADSWRYLYEKLCKKFHVMPESREQLDERLNKDEQSFAVDQDGEQANRFNADRKKGQTETLGKAYRAKGPESYEEAAKRPVAHYITAEMVRECNRANGEILDRVYADFLIERLEREVETSFAALTADGKASLMLTYAAELDKMSKDFAAPIAKEYRKRATAFRLRAALVIEEAEAKAASTGGDGCVQAAPASAAETWDPDLYGDSRRVDHDDAYPADDPRSVPVGPMSTRDLDAAYIFGEGGGVGAGKAPSLVSHRVTPQAVCDHIDPTYSVGATRPADLPGGSVVALQASAESKRTQPHVGPWQGPQYRSDYAGTRGDGREGYGD